MLVCTLFSVLDPIIDANPPRGLGEQPYPVPLRPSPPFPHRLSVQRSRTSPFTFQKNNSSPTLARLEAWENEQPKQLYPVPLHSTTQPPFPTDSASRASPFSNQLKPRHEIDSIKEISTQVKLAAEVSDFHPTVPKVGSAVNNQKLLVNKRPL